MLSHGAHISRSRRAGNVPVGMWGPMDQEGDCRSRISNSVRGSVITLLVLSTFTPETHLLFWKVSQSMRVCAKGKHLWLIHLEGRLKR